MLARYVHNDRLVDGLNRQAFAALIASPAPAAATTSNAPAASATTPRHANSAPADRHPARLRKTGTRYDENTAWAHRQRNNYQGVPWGDAAVKVIASSLTQPLRGAGDEHNR